MENSDHHQPQIDFMNVDSFSQLPFLRPSPAAASKADHHNTAPLRLFGFDFSSPTTDATITATPESSPEINPEQNTKPESDTTTTTTSNDSGRKFECHYCCRHFPTSQALGGHQNAHKRERQHAKRAHLHSFHPATANSITDPHMYSLLNYHHHRSTAALSSYPSWNSTRYSHNYHYTPAHNHYQPPTINGNPLPMWRIPPAAAAPHSHHVAAIGHRSTLPLMTSAMPSDYTKSSDPFKQQASATDNVSLDLHL